MAVSNKEFRYGLQEDSALKPPRLSIEEVKGTSAAQWGLQLKGIQEQWVLESPPVIVGSIYSEVFWIKLPFYQLTTCFTVIALLITDVLLYLRMCKLHLDF